MNSTTYQLARCFLAGPTDYDSLFRNGAQAIEKLNKARWFPPTVEFVARGFAEDTVRPTYRQMVDMIHLCPHYRRAWLRDKIHLRYYSNIYPTAEMVPGANDWGVPPVTQKYQLAKLLETHPDDLGWLLLPQEQKDHYHLLWHDKRGTTKSRLIEAPKPLLKATQRALLTKVIEKIPAHDVACGFERGRSVLDFVTPHCGKDWVLKMDFENFFPSIVSGRVVRLFMTAGYPQEVAKWMTQLCTHFVPISKLRESNLTAAAKRALARNHLPQGTPTSPALANRVAYRFDCRITGLAKALDITYHRYADDLLFSGERKPRKQIERFRDRVAEIAIEEGFHINQDKTRLMYSSQRQLACGVVLNDHPNIDRKTYDNLKAILNNCLSHGWQSQNRDNHPEFLAHLSGRVNWVEQINQQRGERLKKLFVAI